MIIVWNYKIIQLDKCLNIKMRLNSMKIHFNIISKYFQLNILNNIKSLLNNFLIKLGIAQILIASNIIKNGNPS